jgi:hypothetical protein
MPFLAFKEIQVKQSTGNTEKEKKRRGSRIGYLLSYQASHNFKKISQFIKEQAGLMGIPDARTALLVLGVHNPEIYIYMFYISIKLFIYHIVKKYKYFTNIFI